MKFLSHVWSIARGSVGGITYTANQFQSLIARARVSPANPQSQRQELIRSSFAEANARWVDITPAERESWNDYAKGTVYSGPTGDYTLTGRLSFIASISLVSYQAEIGGGTPSVIITAPATPGFLNLGPFTMADIVTASSTGIAVSIGNESGEDSSILLNVSPGVSQTRNSVPGRWDEDKTQVIDVADGTTVLTEILDLEQDLAYFVKIRGAGNTDSNRISNLWIGRRVSNTTGP